MCVKTTRYEQVAGRILTLINNGVLKEGDKVPSLRQLSGEMNVSVNTVKEAYWRLEDSNHIVAVPQSGFYVKKQSSLSSVPMSISPQAIDPHDASLCSVYGALQAEGVGNSEISLAIAALNPELWPTEKMGRYVTDTLRFHENEVYNYLMPPGYLPLREQIARLGLSSGFTVTPEEIIITSGCHEAVFLALMAVCKPGDTVVFESPIYFNLLQLLKQQNLKIIEIPSSDTDGINLETLQFVLENNPVKAMFSISNFNNPMGFTMPSWKKKKLVKLLAGFDIPLIEDDIYGDIGFEQRPDICKSYDTSNNVILCSSFSKTIAPGIRIGWIVPGKHFDQIIKAKTLMNLATPSLYQIAVARFLKEGGYERHLRKLRKKLLEQVKLLRQCIFESFPPGTCVTNPDGGFLLWVELPQPVNTLSVYHEALEKKILIAPGELFSVKGKYTNCMRLNAGIWNKEVEAAIRYLGRLCYKQL